MPRTAQLIWGFCLFVSLCSSSVWADIDRSARSEDPPRQALPTRIEHLIQQLGAEQYSRRQGAASELRYLGLRTMDQLLAAQLDENPEIRLAAQHLVGELVLEWTQPDDPSIVGFVLKDYQEQSVSERRSRALWLAQLEDGVGVEPLCRIVRYERSEVLAKLAALDLMKYLDLTDEDQRSSLSSAAKDVLGESPRRPAQWLQTFAEGVERPPQNVTAWQQFAERERSLPPNGASTSDEIVAGLLQWCAEQAISQNQIAAAHAAIADCVELQKDQPAKLLEHGYWLLDQKQWKLFEELIIERFPEPVSQNPLFTYALAEAALYRGDAAGAASLSEKAFAMTDEKAATATDPLDTIWSRSRTAIRLEDRGLTEWSIREYRRIASMETPHWRMEAFKDQATRLLAELLHDRRRDKEAADVLSEFLTHSRSLRFSQNRFDNEWSSIVSRMHFFRSEQYRQEANRKLQVSHLEQGIEADPTDADVLIAMYRLPRADEKWVQDTERRVQQAVETYQGRLERLQDSGVLSNRYEIATELNQIAWLVSNTTGDYERAIAQSRRSLELRPRSAGSLDTLGRTYFAVGDLENALKYQRRAVKLEPHSEQIRRQLDEFEAAARKQAQSDQG